MAEHHPNDGGNVEADRSARSGQGLGCAGGVLAVCAVVVVAFLVIGPEVFFTVFGMLTLALLDELTVANARSESEKDYRIVVEAQVQVGDVVYPVNGVLGCSFIRGPAFTGGNLGLNDRRFGRVLPTGEAVMISLARAGYCGALQEGSDDRLAWVQPPAALAPERLNTHGVVYMAQAEAPDVVEYYPPNTEFDPPAKARLISLSARPTRDVDAVPAWETVPWYAEIRGKIEGRRSSFFSIF
ncbi:MAG: hypothetical protein ACFB2Z_04920 [Maricaulaceae bacterium]